MALIDKEAIYAEIERRITDENKLIWNAKKRGTYPSASSIAIICALTSFRDFLDTLPEQQPVEVHIDNPNIEKFDPSVKVEMRTDGTGDIDGKAMLYVADKSYKIGYRDGKASKEQPVDGLDVTDFCKPVDPGIAQCIADHWWEMIGEESTNTKPVEGLEEEIDACWQNWLSPSNQKEVEGVLPKTEFAMYARHFAEWGAEHLKR